jgi:hypothetical protein
MRTFALAMKRADDLRWRFAVSTRLGDMIRAMTTILVSTTLLLAGCSTVATTPRPDDYMTPAEAPAAQTPESLFGTDAALLTDQDIQRILEHRFVPVPRNRIAVLVLGGDRWRGWSDDLARLSAETQSALIGTLRMSDFVYDASYLPALLIPSTRTVAAFREAAARYQADLLLVYRNACSTYARYRMLSADTAKAYCTVEAALIDVRTGIVPFSVVSSRDFVATRRTNESNVGETVRRAELETLAAVLSEIGTDITAFLAITRAQAADIPDRRPAYF